LLRHSRAAGRYTINFTPSSIRGKLLGFRG
jgi:hypothetical protein